MRGIAAFPMTDALGVCVGAALRGALLLTVASVAAGALRRRTAAERHAVWAAALAAHLALPGLAWLVPAYLPWTVQWTLSWALPWAAAVPARPVADVLAVTGSAHAGARGAVGLGWVWLAGAGLVLGRRLAGALALRRHVRDAYAPSEETWHAPRADAVAALGVRRPVQLLQGGALGVPVTWGILRPVILLPRTATGWDAARRRVVLLHETAHVARWDAVPLLVAQAVCGVFWWDPLVWMAARRLRDEAERAADDRVVRAGIAPSAYVANLLAFARERRTAPTLTGALALSGWTRRHGTYGAFERRMRAVLDPRVDRRPLGRAVAAAAPAGTLALAGMLSLQSLQPPEYARGAGSTPADAAPHHAAVSTPSGALPHAPVPRPPARDEQADEQATTARRHAIAGEIAASLPRVETPPAPVVRTPRPDVSAPPEPVVPTPPPPSVGAVTSPENGTRR